MRNNIPIAVLLAFVVVLWAQPASASTAIIGEDQPSGGGDVLKPGKKSASTEKSEGVRILLGFDAGLTYSSFTNGHVNYFLPNPYISKAFADGNDKPYLHYLSGTAFEGKGWGFAAGGALDVIFTRNIGVTAKLGYNMRKATFDQELNSGVFASDVTTTLHDNTEWTFHYINLDLLLRLALPLRNEFKGSGLNSIYLLAGPSFNVLAANKAKLTETIVGPAGIYYYQDLNGQLSTENQITKAETSGEINGFESVHTELKFGLGAEIALSDNLYLTPEVTYSIPLSKLIKPEYTGLGSSHLTGPYPDANGNFHDPFLPGEAGYHGEAPSLGTRYLGSSVQDGYVFSTTNPDFNVSTLFLTIGLRWRIN